VGLDGDAGRFRWIDVVTRLEFGPWFEWHVPLAGSVLERRAGEGGIWRPAPADAFWALALHALLDGPGTPARHGAALRELAPAAEPAGRWADVIPPRDRRAILEAIAAGDWSGLAAIGRRLRSRPPTRGGPWATALRVARRWGRRAARRFEPLLAGRGRAGLTVALLGPDGAGKSTLAEAIVRAYPFPARVAYLGLWQADRAGGRHWPGRELLPRLAAAWRAWGSGRLRRARGWLVVFDRYPSDALLRAQPGSPWRSRLYFSLIGRSIPTPDLVLVLDAPAAVLQARKPEHPLAEIEADRAGYARLVQRYPRSRHVDVDRPMAEVEREVARAIWSAVVARWPR
jgi:thymidylate kinase